MISKKVIREMSDLDLSNEIDKRIGYAIGALGLLNIILEHDDTSGLLPDVDGASWIFSDAETKLKEATKILEEQSYRRKNSQKSPEDAAN